MANQIASFNMPTQYDLERSKIDRAQRMAEMLMQQSQAPAEQFSYGGYTAPTSPITGVSKIIQGLMSQYQMGQADDKLEALGVKTRGEAADWMRELGAAQGAPAVPGRPAVPGLVDATGVDYVDRDDPAGSQSVSISPEGKIPTMPGMGEGPNVGVAESAGSPEVPRLGKAAMFDLLARGQGNPVSSGLANAQLARLLAPPEFKAVGVDDRTGTLDTSTGRWTETAGGEPSKPYRGTGEGAQDYNILLTGDPRSAVYAAAFNRQAAPRTFQDPSTGEIISRVPDMTAFQRPLGGASVGGERMGAPGSTTAAAPPTTGPTRPDVVKLKEINLGLSGIETALVSYERAINEASSADFTDAVLGGRTPGGARLRAAWTNFALFAKDEALYKLGVLAGPDLSLIEKAIPDPSTFSGAARTKSSHQEGINQIRDILQARRSAANKQYGGAPASGTSQPPAGGPPKSQDFNWVPGKGLVPR